MCALVWFFTLDEHVTCPFGGDVPVGASGVTLRERLQFLLRDESGGLVVVGSAAN